MFLYLLLLFIVMLICMENQECSAWNLINNSCYLLYQIQIDCDASVTVLITQYVCHPQEQWASTAAIFAATAVWHQEAVIRI